MFVSSFVRENRPERIGAGDRRVLTECFLNRIGFGHPTNVFVRLHVRNGVLDFHTSPSEHDPTVLNLGVNAGDGAVFPELYFVHNFHFSGFGAGSNAACYC